MNKLSYEQVVELCREFNYDPQAIWAVVKVETPGYGFSPTTGKILIQFEPHIFKRYSRVSIVNGVEGQTAEWKAFELAKKQFPRYARLSTSWGLGQIMGFNFQAAGYATVEDMIWSFQQGEYNQLKGMLTFIKNKRNIDKALRAKDWRTFAYYYNGSLYHLNKYDVKLKRAYEAVVADPRTPLA